MFCGLCRPHVSCGRQGAVYVVVTVLAADISEAAASLVSCIDKTKQVCKPRKTVNRLQSFIIQCAKFD